MDLKDIRELVRLVDKSSVTELEIENDGTKVRIAKNKDVEYVTAPQMAPVAYSAPAVAPLSSAQPVSTETADVAGDYIEVRSPMVGTFYESSSPEADAYVKVGDTIENGQTLCIIEAMKIMNELQSEYSGKIAKIMVKNSEPVEFNQVLFLLEK
jgi:acetyl-CoA carboxylase biotin carboxyl carrier protein